MLRGHKKESYIVNHDYFKRWSSNMAYILGFIVADGNIQRDGNYVKVEVKPDDVAVLNFISNEITPNYRLRQSRPSEIRWYPASKTIKQDLMKLGVIPAKTGNEIIPPGLPNKYFWDFVRGLFDGDGCVTDDSIYITSNSKKILFELMKKTGGLGRISKINVNWNWFIENNDELLVFYKKLYHINKFSLERKKNKFNHLVNFVPSKIGRWEAEEDNYLKKYYTTKTRFEMSLKLGRKASSVKNRLCKLKLRSK